MWGKGHPRRSFLLATSGVVGLVSVAAAQDGLGGKTLRVTVGQSLEYGDNLDLVVDPDGNELRSSTRLGLSYSDVTRTQALRFNAGGSIETGSDGDENSVNDPFARLSYALTGANSQLNFSASYRETDVDDAFANQSLTSIDDGNLSTSGLTTVNNVAQVESGSRIDTQYTAGFETGLKSNVGLRLDISDRSRRFSGVSDPDLFDTSDQRANLLTTFRIDPQITARVTASTRRFTAENTEQTERTENAAGVGVVFNVAPETTLDLSLGYRRAEVEQVSETTVASGATYGATLDRQLANGSIGISFNSLDTTSGRRNTLRANRSMALPGEASLSYGIGVSRTDGLSSEPLFTLDYQKPLKQGRFGISFSQEARIDEEDDDAVILTRLSANYAMALSPTIDWSINAGLDDVSAKSATGEDRRRINLASSLNGEINPVSSWSAGITFTDTETSSSLESEDQQRYSVQVAYRREMAREWDMVARYQHTSIVDSDDPDRRSSAISVGIEKTFSFRP